MDKQKLSQLLGVRVDSMEKAISRMGLSGVEDSTIPDILAYYAVPNPRRDPATVAAAQNLLQQNQNQGGQIVFIQNDNRVVNTVPTELAPAPEPTPEPIPVPEVVPIDVVADVVKKPGFSVSALLANREVLAVLVLIGAVAMAKAITAPIFMSVGIGFWWAYILSLYVDIAGFVFVWHRRHMHGKLFAISTALQTALTVGALGWMGTDAVMITKGLTVSACLGIAVHGFSEIIAKK